MDVIPMTKTVTLTDDGTGYGSLDGTTSFEVDPGSTITISGDTVTVGTDTVTAEPLSNTAQYTYDFVNWTVGGVAVTGTYTIDADTTIVANFSRTTNTYAVTITAGEGGSVSDSSIANVPYGTAWSTSGDTLTIGSDTVTAIPDTATAQYTYTVDAWSPASGTVEGATAISVSFTATLNSYTITYMVEDVPTEEVLDYGETPDPEDPVAPEGYRFYRWDPAIVPVTGNATYTAVFVEEGSTIIVLDANGGSSPINQIQATQGQPIGELPTPTRMGFDFDGWFTAAEGGVEVTADTIVTEDMTIYAQWEITSTWNTYKILVYAMITLLFVGIAVAILRNYVGGDRF